jgi:tRNA-splicing ligase RtcB
MKVLSTEKLPVKMWLDDIEESAMDQIKNLANLPFAYHHIAIMPDCHKGYGMPIGGVMATLGVVVPNAVGVDIGCGMCAVKTSLTKLDTPTLKKIMGEIRKAVPVGFGHHKQKQDESLMPDGDSFHSALDGQNRGIVFQEYNNALTQIGTLGGGNHFIEIQKGSDGYIWIMIHSGSRNFGLKIAKYYNDLAIRLNEKWYSEVPKKWELAFLPIDSDEGKNYITEMNYAVDFALVNRKLMMDRIINIFGFVLSDGKEYSWGVEPIINIAHNYATFENHFGKNVLVHRKGATLAREGTIGIIPGSQGTKSYIVKGLGNPESFESCSHGAGRKMGRKDAERNLDLADEVKKLDDQGIIHAIRGIHDLDEASGAYKSIETVMENQKELVEVLVELSPLGVIKG